MSNEVRLNESGFKIKECSQCKQDYNINSFNGDICVSCIEDNKIKIFEVVEGDYNDIFRKRIFKADSNQMDRYCKDQFDPKDDDMTDLGTDSIGYECYYPTDKDGEVEVEYYIEAREIEDYKPEYGNIDVDLTENNEDSV